MGKRMDGRRGVFRQTTSIMNKNIVKNIWRFWPFLCFFFLFSWFWYRYELSQMYVLRCCSLYYLWMYIVNGHGLISLKVQEEFISSAYIPIHTLSFTIILLLWPLHACLSHWVACIRNEIHVGMYKYMYDKMEDKLGAEWSDLLCA